MSSICPNPAMMQAFIQSIQDDSRLNVDPIRSPYENTQIDFDHEVNYFEQGSSSQYNINVENIRAAGTLYYIMILADNLGVLRVADHVLMTWTSGHLDIPLGETATSMYNYYKLRSDRTSPEERNTLYKLVFNIGEGRTLGDMAVNQNFASLWDSLMNEVVRYIQKRERSDNPETVSKSSIHQSISALQHNLSRSTSGIVKVLIPEMYAHLENALTILGAPDVVSQLGQGIYKDVWNVIERVSMEQDQVLPNVQAYRDIAVFAHKIFMAISDFTSSSFQDSDFQDFIFNVESFVIAQSQLGAQDIDYDHEDVEEVFENAERKLETADQDWDF